MIAFPVYGFVISAESDVFPLNYSNMGVPVNAPGVNNAPTGDIIWHITTDWGAHPSILGVTDWINEDFLDVGLEAYGYFYGV